MSGSLEKRSGEVWIEIQIIFIEENKFENVVCEMVIALTLPQ